MLFAHNFRKGQLAIHYHKHGVVFGPISRKAYLRCARAFLNLYADGYWVQENIRGSAWGIFSGDRVHFDITTEEFGVVDAFGYIRTYFIPDPAVHGYSTNYDYFLSQA